MPPGTPETGAGDDPVLLNDWHPVADAAQLPPGTLKAVRLLERDIVLWRDSDGTVHAWEDRCPHRGTRLSIGRIVDDQLICAYHGWRFASSGRCVHFPALPAVTPPESACARAYRAAEQYGLVWLCVGEPQGEILPFPEYHNPGLRKVVCGPYEVHSSGPRIVENFLDMAHFPFVHAGILGEEPKNEVCDYQVAPFDDGAGAAYGMGVLATECFFWQPQTNSLAHGGTMVEYTYRVVRPLTAILTKIPEAQDGFHEAISLHVQPVAEESSVVWILLAMTNFEQEEQQLRDFQDRIFLQDKPILENQVPRRLPLAPRAEMPIRSDRMSVAYRAYLRSRGLRYGAVLE
jgi:phenylpropionate dioxygenase-like ring-hydroxylating dioxygenase large terminal subunit